MQVLQFKADMLVAVKVKFIFSPDEMSKLVLRKMFLYHQGRTAWREHENGPAQRVVM